MNDAVLRSHRSRSCAHATHQSVPLLYCSTSPPVARPEITGQTNTERRRISARRMSPLTHAPRPYNKTEADQRGGNLLRIRSRPFTPRSAATDTRLPPTTTPRLPPLIDQSCRGVSCTPSVVHDVVTFHAGLQGSGSGYDLRKIKLYTSKNPRWMVSFGLMCGSFSRS